MKERDRVFFSKCEYIYRERVRERERERERLLLIKER